MRCTILVSASVLLLANGQALAQESMTNVRQSEAAAVAQSNPAQARCVVKIYKDSQGVDRSLIIPALPGDGPALGARGFAPGLCGSVNPASYRNKVCRLVHLGNSAVQKRLEQVLGAAPATLCAAARKAAPFPNESGSPPPS